MIRRACPADAQALADLAAATPGTPLWTLAQHRDMLNTPVPDHAVWVAQLGEAIIGFAALSVHPPEAELESIAVLPAHQHRGHGHALLSAALQHAVDIGIAEVHLEVRTSSPAQVLYRRLGFVVKGRRPRYYNDPVEDALLMQWTAAATEPTGNAVSGIIEIDYGS